MNGFPDDPIELPPFNKIFSCSNIWKSQCKVGFISMNQNALYDDKVQQQLGGGKAAFGDYSKQLLILAKDYKNVAKEVTEIGFNGDLLYLKVEVTKPSEVIDAKDELVNKLVAEKAVNPTIQLYSLGAQVANSKIVTKTTRK